MSFHPQANAVIERMNRTLMNIRSKCLGQNQSDRSTLLPFVLTAFRSSVHESTGFTPYFLVSGHEMSLPLDLMYQPPEHSEPSSLRKLVLVRQEAIRKAFELVRRNTTALLLNSSDEVPCVIAKCTDQCTKKVTAFSFVTPSPHRVVAPSYLVIGEAPTASLNASMM